LAVATLIAGVLLILMGLFRMGALLKFIPYPVMVGFTTGIALIIFSSRTGRLSWSGSRFTTGGLHRKVAGLSLRNF
jgi:MFS superfamily sulfate permease-like transporter